MMLLDILKKYEPSIRFMEFSAFLHDADKATPEFKAKPSFHTLKKYDYTDAIIEEKKTRWTSYFSDYNPAMPDCGLNTADIAENTELAIICDNCKFSDAFVWHHLNEYADKRKIHLPFPAAVVHAGVCAADGFDSGLDKADGGKSQQEPFLIATPFQKEAAKWDNTGFFDGVKKLLNENAPIRSFEPFFSKVLGETRIPFNDVTLWAHSFNVASFAKSIFAKILMEYHSGIRQTDGKYQLPYRGVPSLRYLKFELDRDSLLNQAHTAADILGLNADCETLMNTIRDIYEKLGAGNEIYRDQTRQLFTMPVLCDSLNTQFEKEFVPFLEAAVSDELKKLHLEQLSFSIKFRAEMVQGKLDENKLIKDASALLKEPGIFYHASEPLADLYAEAVPGRVCDICGLRNAQSGRDNDDHLCVVCSSRRKGYDFEIGSLERTGNKLALFSLEADLTDLRSGKLFNDFYQGKKENEKVLASPGRLYRAHDTLKLFFRNFIDTLPCRCFPITLSPERLDFAVPGGAADQVLEQLIQSKANEFGPFRIPLKTGVIFFYKTFPLYAVLDASNRMRSYLKPDGFDFMLLDNAGERHVFQNDGRRHHIFGKAHRYTLDQFLNFMKAWSSLNRLEKSQISHIENSLIAKLFEWKGKAGSTAFREFSRMILFAPNAFGKEKCSDNEDFLLNSATSGLILDVIDFYIHIENKK